VSLWYNTFITYPIQELKMSENYFTITIENNKPVIIDQEGKDAEKTVIKMEESYSLFEKFIQLYTVSLIGYVAYGIISFMMGGGIDWPKILGTILFGFGLIMSYAYFHEISTFKGRYLRAFGEAKMKLQNQMAELEMKTLKHRIALETVEKEAKMNFVTEKQKEINA